MSPPRRALVAAAATLALVPVGATAWFLGVLALWSCWLETADVTRRGRARRWVLAYVAFVVLPVAVGVAVNLPPG